MTRTLPLRPCPTGSLAATVVLALGVMAAPVSALISHPGTNNGQAGSAPATVHKGSPSGGFDVVRPNPDQQLAGAAAASHKYSSTSSLGTARPRTASASPGFQFGDAAIGAAGGVALSMLGLGGVLLASRRRTRRSESATA